MCCSRSCILSSTDKRGGCLLATALIAATPCVRVSQLITEYWQRQRSCSACAEHGKVNNNWGLHNCVPRPFALSHAPTSPSPALPPLITHFWLNVVNSLPELRNVKAIVRILQVISNGQLEFVRKHTNYMAYNTK